MDNKNEEILKLIEDLRPYLNMDGGDLEFVKYEDNFLYIKLTGACQGCMFQDNTINEGIFEYFKKALPDLEGVINVNL
jgi:Fe-S cluster biogenesis protein NfuA